MPSYRLRVRGLVRGVRAVSVGKVRRLTPDMLHHLRPFCCSTAVPFRLASGHRFGRFGSALVPSTLAARRRAPHTDLSNPVENYEGIHAWPTLSRRRRAIAPTR